MTMEFTVYLSGGMEFKVGIVGCAVAGKDGKERSGHGGL